MSDPYNSYPSELPPPAISRVVSDASSQSSTVAHEKNDAISSLDVSDKWKERFHLIEEAGGPRLPNSRDLTFAQSRKITSNWLAFFFWPIYLPIKGLWRQAIAYFVIGVTAHIGSPTLKAPAFYLRHVP